LHFFWLRSGTPDLQGTAQYLGSGSDIPEATAFIDTSFPNGPRFAAR
jgi:hypothetical protein